MQGAKATFSAPFPRTSRLIVAALPRSVILLPNEILSLNSRALGALAAGRLRPRLMKTGLP